MASTSLEVVASREDPVAFHSRLTLLPARQVASISAAVFGSLEAFHRQEAPCGLTLFANEASELLQLCFGE